MKLSCKYLNAYLNINMITKYLDTNSALKI